jgi:hypothetical protein
MRSFGRRQGGSGRGHFYWLRKGLYLDSSSWGSILGACGAASLARLWLCRFGLGRRIFGLGRRIFGSFRCVS